MSLALCCPDKFGGSLTAVQAARAMADGLRDTGIEARELALADGGEGTRTPRPPRRAAAQRPRYRTVRPAAVVADWALLEDGTAVIEQLALSGGLLVTLCGYFLFWVVK